MTTDTEQRRIEDVANAAAILLGAVEDAPDRALDEVETLYADALVALDDDAADVTLHEEGATVHVRLDSSRSRTA